MLPQCVSPNMAAALTGRSPQAIRKLIDDGVLPATKLSSRWLKIPLRAVEELTGRKVTAGGYLEAQQSLEQRREYWRRYRRQERESGTGRVHAA